MTNVRKKLSPDFKLKVALEALTGNKTTNALSSEYGVHSTQINAWKKHLKEEMQKIFLKKSDKNLREKDTLIERLYGQIGQLTYELEWFKKKVKLFDGRG
jgi:transposase